MKPATSRPSSKESRTNLMLDFIYRHRWPLAGVTAISGVVNLLALTGSLYMLQVYDRVLTSRSLPTLVGLTVLMIGVMPRSACSTCCAAERFPALRPA
jgi:ABC-type protease/lipase transport system fused ATPase/permease subunit